jgi:hypothetical protein
MLRDHCGDCYELLTDVRVLNTLANLLGGKWTVWICDVPNPCVDYLNL